MRDLRESMFVIAWIGLFSSRRYSNPLSTYRFSMRVILLLLRVNLRSLSKVSNPSTTSISLLSRFSSVSSVKFSRFSIFAMRLPAKLSSLMLSVCTSTICLMVLLLRLRVSRCCSFYNPTISIKKFLEMSTVSRSFN